MSMALNTSLLEAVVLWNLHTNTMIRKLIDADVAISPACNDSGQALGAALFVARCLRGANNNPCESVD